MLGERGPVQRQIFLRGKKEPEVRVEPLHFDPRDPTELYEFAGKFATKSPPCPACIEARVYDELVSNRAAIKSRRKR